MLGLLQKSNGARGRWEESNNRRMMVNNRTTGMRVANLAITKRELFNPKNKTNINSTAHILDIVSVGMPQMKKELIDTRKATWRNLYL